MVLESGPRLLLLDEPSLGLSPGNQDKIFATIADLRRHGLTVLVVEQNAHGALQISDTGIVMELGRLFMTGPAAQVIERGDDLVLVIGHDTRFGQVDAVGPDVFRDRREVRVLGATGEDLVTDDHDGRRHPLLARHERDPSLNLATSGLEAA